MKIGTASRLKAALWESEDSEHLTHRALKFGRETRTPAMQAGVVSTRLTWSHIFTARGLSRPILVAVVRIPVIGQLRETGTAQLPTFLWPLEQRTAA